VPQSAARSSALEWPGTRAPPSPTGRMARAGGRVLAAAADGGGWLAGQTPSSGVGQRAREDESEGRRHCGCLLQPGGPRVSPHSHHTRRLFSQERARDGRRPIWRARCVPFRVVSCSARMCACAGDLARVQDEGPGRLWQGRGAGRGPLWVEGGEKRAQVLSVWMTEHSQRDGHCAPV